MAGKSRADARVVDAAALDKAGAGVSAPGAIVPEVAAPKTAAREVVVPGASVPEVDAPGADSQRAGTATASKASRKTRGAAARSGRLYVVGTPIGNLGDLSPRAVEAFRAADAVCCEDTRVTGKLLAAAGVSRPLIRCDENVIARRAPELVERLAAGEVLAFASDAGMPGVSDPGQVLVEAARAAEVPVEVIPGPTACITALVSSGIACDHFFFEGFLPRKAGERARRLAELAPVPGALLFYESPHRVGATLDALAVAFPAREAALCRELTKLHEEVLRGTAVELASEVAQREETGAPLKGEMVIVVAPPSAEELEVLGRLHAAGLAATQGDGTAAGAGPALDPDEALRADILRALEEGEPANAIAKRLSQRYSRRKRAVYELVLELQG